MLMLIILEVGVTLFSYVDLRLCSDSRFHPAVRLAVNRRSVKEGEFVLSGQEAGSVLSHQTISGTFPLSLLSSLNSISSGVLVVVSEHLLSHISVLATTRWWNHTPTAPRPVEAWGHRGGGWGSCRT